MDALGFLISRYTPASRNGSNIARICTSVLAGVLALGCTIGGDSNGEEDAGTNPIIDGGFFCINEEAVACIANTHYSCVRDSEFLSTVVDDCDLREDGRNTCVEELGCAVCRPNDIFCRDNNVVECNAEGTDFEVEEECILEEGEVCRQGSCINLCDLAIRERSYQGCEFYGVDLDNASIERSRNAAGQQFSIVASNPSSQPTEVWVEMNRGAFGQDPDVVELARLTLLPGDLEVFNLPRREVDGASSFAVCGASTECNQGESCYCAGGTLVEDGGTSSCRCRNAPEADGINDGTHSALSSHAYRVRSTLPIIAYQFNPLDNVGVFSNDASLLLPTSAVGRQYTVVGWPQTIAHSEDSSEDFDSSRDDEDLRAFLTIVGTSSATHVTVTLGPEVRTVVRPGGGFGAEGDVWEYDIGPFDVVNLETQGFNADFTGTVVTADQPVSVFTGSEASDAPRFDVLANRQCCADHLEEQLFPNDTLGRRFFIGRMPRRTTALNAAFLDPTRDSVGEFNEPESVRVVAVSEGVTQITTSLPAPDDAFPLNQGRSVILRADQDVEINADNPVAVLQVLPSQQTVGIPSDYPGGDPAIIAVPPVEQYRQEYVFLTPGLYAFDFITIVAPRGALLELDGVDLIEYECEEAPADGIPADDRTSPPDYVVHRCQLSFPDVVGPRSPVEDGVQNDGYHRLVASDDVGIVIYGFDAFVSYAYAGGLNLDPLPQ